MRNISFALTARQMRDRSKTVTRRRGDYYARVLKPGDLVCAVEKSQGIKRGGLVRICVIRVLTVSTEHLYAIECYPNHGADECEREGFPDMLGRDFVVMFCKHVGGYDEQTVTRIEFEHTDLPVPMDTCDVCGEEGEMSPATDEEGTALRICDACFTLNDTGGA